MAAFPPHSGDRCSGAAFVDRESALADLGPLAWHNSIASLAHGFVPCQLQQVGVDIVDAPADESDFGQDADRGLSDGFALAHLIGLGYGNLFGPLPDFDQAAGAATQR